MLTSTRVLGAVVIGAAAGLLLGGCTSGSQAAPTAAPTVVAPPTTVASPSAPSVESEPAPSPTVERNRDTAKQFIIDYFEAYEEGLRTGSPEPLAGMGTSACAKCAGMLDGLAGMKADRSRRPHAVVTVVPFESRVSTDPELMTWTATYESSLGALYVGNDVVKPAGNRTVTNVHLEVVHNGDAWHMNGMATDGDLAKG